jgi:NADPH:quinone reductase-like Zn-dependent oxidoreductase
MRAILRTRFGGPDVLVIREIPEPEPKDGHAVIQVKAFGLNHRRTAHAQGGVGRLRDTEPRQAFTLVGGGDRLTAPIRGDKQGDST